jgi:hypothetical protein
MISFKKTANREKDVKKELKTAFFEKVIIKKKYLIESASKTEKHVA